MTFEEVYKILYKKYKVARWDDVDKELKVRDTTTISTWELFALRITPACAGNTLFG